MTDTTPGSIPQDTGETVGTTEVGRPGARLELPGNGTADARIEVIYQSRATRLSRALITLGLAVVIAPVVFFIPPHFLWPLLVLGAGGYLARRYWKGSYYVVEFKGSCPRCGAELEIEEGARIGRRHGMECFSCHRHPELVLDEPDE